MTHLLATLACYLGSYLPRHTKMESMIMTLHDEHLLAFRDVPMITLHNRLSDFKLCYGHCTFGAAPHVT